jgi:predicted RNase H-like HicB family nuclease
MEYVYPAIFHHNIDDGSYTIIFPDLKGCVSEGKSIGEAIYMAQDVLRLYIDSAIRHKADMPKATTEKIKVKDNEFVTYIRSTSTPKTTSKTVISKRVLAHI